MMRKKIRLRRFVAVTIAVLGVASLIWTLCTPAVSDRLIEGLLSPRSVFLQAAPWLPEPPESEAAEAVSTAIETPSEDQHTPQQEAGDIEFELLEIEPDVPESIRIELLDTAAAKIDLGGKKPKVIIYHTHFSEAYTATRDAPYVETSRWRTNDTKNNIVEVGNALTDALRKYGIEVIHDTTNNEPPKLGTAYTRSLTTMQKYKKQYPSIEIFIDLHRDAYTLPKGITENNDYAVIDGKKVARVMFVVGTGEGKTGEGFAEKPDFKENYALAKAISDQLNTISPKLTRQIRVKTGRYNQHVGRCLLIEIGHNQNTLEEALNATQYLAKAIAKAAGKG